MRRVLLISSVLAVLAAFALILIFSKGEQFYSDSCLPGNVTPVFSPDNSQIVLDMVGQAKREVDVEMYEFSSKDFENELASLSRSGVVVRVILEPSVSQNLETMSFLLNNGIEANWASKKFHNTHSKFVVIDDYIVIVGSMNWSENGLKENREASAIIYSKEVSSRFKEIFDSDFG